MVFFGSDTYQPKHKILIVETGEDYAEEIQERDTDIAIKHEAVEYAEGLGFKVWKEEFDGGAEIQDNGIENVIAVFVKPEGIA